jgi:hypothetical protein
MPANHDATRLDVSGVWNGVYSYAVASIAATPVAFVASLAESDSGIVGVTVETMRGGPAPATLCGRRAGRAVAFVKRYDRRPHCREIHYEGELSGDGTEIRGRWRIVPFPSGTFLMIRARPVASAAQREAVAQI